MSSDGHPLLTYLDAAGEEGGVMVLLLEWRKEVMTLNIGCDSHK